MLGAVAAPTERWAWPVFRQSAMTGDLGMQHDDRHKGGQHDEVDSRRVPESTQSTHRSRQARLTSREGGS
jgi:hypothetical protein